MQVPVQNERERAVRRLSPSERLLAHFAGWTALIAVHAVALAINLPASVPSKTWFAVQTYCAAQLLTVAAIAILAGRVVSAVATRWLTDAPRRLGPTVSTLSTLVVLCPATLMLTPEDFSGLAERNAALVPSAVFQWGAAVIVAVVLSKTVVTIDRLGAHHRSAGLAAAMTLAAASATVIPSEYPGLLLALSTSAGLALAAAMTHLFTTPVPVAVRRITLPAATTLFALGPLALITTSPANPTRLVLATERSAVLDAVLRGARSDIQATTKIPAAQVEWFADRSSTPSLPPNRPSPVPNNPLVILLGIDAMRADLFENDVLARRLPHLKRLRDEGVWFSRARSPGASTVPALTAMFSGSYYSQVNWKVHPDRPPGVYPYQDQRKRFPEALAAAGVSTLTVDTTGWLINKFGVVRGFTDESSARKKNYPTAAQAMGALMKRLELYDEEALFAFVHFLDAHAPYGGKKTDPPFERYIQKLARVDTQVGVLVDALRKRRLQERSCIVLYSDHGESFGEHGHQYHAANVYDTLLRVPLVFHCPPLEPAQVTDEVSLMDVGPTILDLFGVPTPGHFIGQSLLEFLSGGSTALTRPLLAEARLKQALITDGHKVIYDTRAKTVELYDLVKDPGELNNLYDPTAERSREMLGRLRAFYDVHTHREPGYTVPYRKW